LINKEKTCCFTGHRAISKDKIDKIKCTLTKTLEELIKQGVCYFGAGGARGFDTLAAQTVLALKEQFPHIKLILVLPCKNQTRGWRQDDIDTYKAILSMADKITYESEIYYDGCMLDRNRHMVDFSGYCICYYDGNGKGGTAYTVRYAKQKGVKLYNVF
jgi:uncharacterized phage-like protein YoqJ